MGDAHLRCSMPGDRRGDRSGFRRGNRFMPGDRQVRRARRAAGISVGAALLIDAGLWLLFPRSFTDLHAEFWVMAALALAVDARPYVLTNRRAGAVVLPSICFTFAIALSWGFVAALAVQLA